MTGTPTFWRIFAGALAVVLATSTAAVSAGGDFWFPLLIGAPAAALLAWRLSVRTEALATSGDPARRAGLDGALQLPTAIDRAPSVSAESPLLATVLETMIEGVMVVDAREHLVYANPAARALLEIPDRAGAGRPLLEAVRSPGIESAMQAALTTGRMQRLELNCRARSGTVAVTIVAAGWKSAAAGVVLVLQDVTGARRLERVREFVSNVSHELKTPLTHIQAYADTLADGALDDPEHSRKFLERIIEQAERLQALIVDLLQLFARIETRRPRLTLPLSLAEVSQRCVEEHQAAAASRNVSLTVECHEEPVVLADAAGLQQILDNLVDNALKYTPAGGSVGVVVFAEPDWGVIEVSDTGIGIARDDQLRVFERFLSCRSCSTRAVGGTGLGRRIVKHLCRCIRAASN
ncbi:MAG: ATP-binding protein [Planctomycetaceae bacterium]